MYSRTRQYGHKGDHKIKCKPEAHGANTMSVLERSKEGVTFSLRSKIGDRRVLRIVCHTPTKLERVPLPSGMTAMDHNEDKNLVVRASRSDIWFCFRDKQREIRTLLPY